MWDTDMVNPKRKPQRCTLSPVSCLTSSASFSSEAVAKAGHLDGQLLFGQDVVHVHGPQGHLCGPCQAQGGVLHTVHLQAPSYKLPNSKKAWQQGGFESGPGPCRLP